MTYKHKMSMEEEHDMLMNAINEHKKAAGVGADPWKHRTEGMRCKTCMWFVPKQAADKPHYDLGRCRRHAPSMNGYPVVYVNDWCGDHRVDENKL